jgi:hypothetical protein
MTLSKLATRVVIEAARDQGPDKEVGTSDTVSSFLRFSRHFFPRGKKRRLF